MNHPPSSWSSGSPGTQPNRRVLFVWTDYVSLLFLSEDDRKQTCKLARTTLASPGWTRTCTANEWNQTVFDLAILPRRHPPQILHLGVPWMKSSCQILCTMHGHIEQFRTHQCGWMGLRSFPKIWNGQRTSLEDHDINLTNSVEGNSSAECSYNQLGFYFNESCSHTEFNRPNPRARSDVKHPQWSFRNRSEKQPAT